MSSTKDQDVIHDADLTHVLKKDGVGTVELGKFENLTTNRLADIKAAMGKPPWAVRVVYNERFGGVLICQNPGEGNRLHYHGEADECWVIMEGEWEWYVESVGNRRVKKHDIVLVRKGTPHKIRCVGDTPAIRFAITMPDVDHVHVPERA